MLNNQLAIVMYHYVRNFKTTAYPRINGLDVELFENQIKYLKKHYNILSMEEVLYLRANNKNLPEKTALLTFDDGYKDHYLEALPLMKKHSLKGSFYIPSQAILEKEVLDVNKIHFLMAVLSEDFLVERIFNFIDENRGVYDLKSNNDYFNMYKDLGYHLDSPKARFIKKMLQMGLPVELRKRAVAELFLKHFPKSEREFSSDLYLSKRDIEEMLREGMHIGSHAHTHQWLNTLSHDEQLVELKHSKDFLEGLSVPKENLTICYPFGGHNADTLSISKSLGFQIGLTTKVGLANLELEDMLALSRIDTNDFPKTFNALNDKWLNQ